MSIISKTRGKISRRLSGESKRHSRTSDGSNNNEKSNADAAASEPPYRTLVSFASGCDDFIRDVQKVEAQLSDLQGSHRRALSAPASSEETRQTENASQHITAQFRGLVSRLQTLRPDPQTAPPGYAAHLSRAENALRAAMLRHTQIEREQREVQRAALKRQYRIVQPDASDEEINAAAASGGDPAQQQVFARALLHGEGRLTAARGTLDAVTERHAAIEKIEGQLVELADLYQLLGEHVALHEAPIQNIEREAETTNKNTEMAALELSEATVKVKAARRKKWTCFWISVVIIVVIIAVVATVVAIMA